MTVLRLFVVAGLGLATACASGSTSTATTTTTPAPAAAQSADPRVGLRPGVKDAGEAAWNMRLVSKTPPPDKFVDGVNSDLAFLGNYVIQGSFNGYQVWDISNPASRRSGRRTSARRRRATSRCTGICSSSPARISRRASIAARRACPTRSARIDCAACASSTSATSAIRETSATSRRAAARTRTPCSSIRKTPRTSTSTSRARPACARRGARRLRQLAGTDPELGALPHRGDQGAARATRSRPRSSARRESSPASARAEHGETPTDLDGSSQSSGGRRRAARSRPVFGPSSRCRRSSRRRCSTAS